MSGSSVGHLQYGKEMMSLNLRRIMVEVLTFSDKSEAQYVGLREEKAGAI